MIDAQFDFDTNDIVWTGGDFGMLSGVSLQNATLLTLKSCACLTKPQFGVGLEDYYAHLPSSMWGSVESAAQTQILNDGGMTASVTIEQDENGLVEDVAIRARYKAE